MCRPATCPICQKASYTGCGQHLDTVFAGVPVADRCRCDSSSASTDGTRASGGFSGWLRRVGS